jgi:hypothetical protein
MRQYSPWIRATSERPVWWICSGVRLVVVWLATRARYHCFPFGIALQPVLVRQAGRYSFSMKLASRSSAGLSRASIVRR